MRPRDNFESLFSKLSEALTVALSKIGKQFYCEKKVHLEQELGEVETPEKQWGGETHEQAAEDTEEVGMDEVWDAADGTSPVCEVVQHEENTPGS